VKRICCECGKPRERCRRVVCDKDGYIHLCCPACWRDYDYQDFIFKIPKAED
jgi:hypothetical protein